ncbi:type II toxin-antitoxin system RelE family toxin [Paenibacillus sp. FA6]|uniref:type II toxin-antitoxin system RelE family toxin n=1 Tax=Paenibacillus sp. FA6 TaxID=3413029 RepID=UPI003F656387
MNERFDIRFDEDAEREYNKLDNSVLGKVNKAIDELVYRADEVGKKLSNHSNTKLAGCKEIKLRDAGIRIVFRVTNEIVEVLSVVYILTIERRNQDYAFKIADRRLKSFKRIPINQLNAFIVARVKWKIKRDDE